MGKFVIDISSYRAVKKATIVNDGITVLSGINGSGKSTLARMFYYAVNYMTQFPSLIFNQIKEEVLDVVEYLSMASLQISRDSVFFLSVRKQEKKIASSENFQDIESNVDEMVRHVEPYLADFFSKSDENRKARILSYLGVNDDGDAVELAKKCVDEVKQKVNTLLEKGNDAIASKKTSDLVNSIKSLGVDMNDFPKDFHILEDGVDLMNQRHFDAPLSLIRAIYVDTPMAVNDHINKSVNYWNSLSSLMNREASIVMSKEEKKMQVQLRDIICGDVSYYEELLGDKKLHYKREDGLDIRLESAATGYKSFSIIYKLLANGFLKENTLLLIDEPEAHLHPQWIVEYANILVKLNKELGVKIFITSHNPDMISAIRAISESEGVLATTHFYLARPCKDDRYHFLFKDLGADIGPIFEEFNVAFSKIEKYGSYGNLS